MPRQLSCRACAKLSPDLIIKFMRTKTIFLSLDLNYKHRNRLWNASQVHWCQYNHQSNICLMSGQSLFFVPNDCFARCRASKSVKQSSMATVVLHGAPSSCLVNRFTCLVMFIFMKSALFLVMACAIQCQFITRVIVESCKRNLTFGTSFIEFELKYKNVLPENTYENVCNIEQFCLGANMLLHSTASYELRSLYLLSSLLKSHCIPNYHTCM